MFQREMIAVDELYELIVDEYKKTGSVKKVVENLGSNTIKVRRVLITEGLWESETSKSVGELYKNGKSVKEIAGILCMSEKNVQSYMPYTRGAYGGEKSNDAIRSEEYRGRMQNAANNQAALREGNSTEIYQPLAGNSMGNNIVDFSDVKKRKETKTDGQGRLAGVLKLRMELISPFFEDYPDKGLDFSKKEKELFLANAKAKQGIIREVLVPGEMNLHAVHYMIQKLFGWQNSHLHNFSLSGEDFGMVTKGKRVDDYMNLCGTLFRYPDSEMDDQFWDDDYEDNLSIKSWLQSKYIHGFIDLAVENTFPRNREYVREFKERFKKQLKTNKNMTLDELSEISFFENSYNILLENLSLRNLFAKSYGREMDISPKDWRMAEKLFVDQKNDYYDAFEKEEPEDYDAMLDLFEKLLELRKSEISIKRGIHMGHEAEIKKQFGRSSEEILEDIEQRIFELESVLIPEMAEGNPQVVPFVDKIYYRYDFGDDWTVRITCTDAYMSDQNFDWHSNDAFNQETWERNKPTSKLTFTNFEGKKMTEEENAVLSKVYLDAMPICTHADGLNVMDDVGGIHGFADFLETINGTNSREAAESRNWAKWMGWTGRKTKPENIL